MNVQITCAGVCACKEETIHAAYEETRCLKIIPSKDSWIMKSLGRCLDHPTLGRRDCESADLLVIPLNQQSVMERDFFSGLFLAH